MRYTRLGTKASLVPGLRIVAGTPAAPCSGCGLHVSARGARGRRSS